MRIEDLMIFADVVLYHSMNVAAEKHFTSPQNLSKIIRNMENALGVVLFKRSKKGSELTPEGERFYLQVQKVLREYNIAIAEIQQGEVLDEAVHQEVASAKMKVLCTQGFTNYSVWNACEAMQENPKYDVQFELDMMHSFSRDNLSEALQKEAYDVVVYSMQEYDWDAFSYEIKNYTVAHVIRDEFALLLSKKHPFSSKSRITQKDLEHLKLVLLKENYEDERCFISQTNCKLVANSLSVIFNQIENMPDYCTILGKSYIDALANTKQSSSLKSIPFDEKNYIVYVVLFNKKMFNEKNVEQTVIREFVKELVSNFSMAKSY